jgi:hypothetical protein
MAKKKSEKKNPSNYLPVNILTKRFHHAELGRTVVVKGIDGNPAMEPADY